MHCVGQIFRAQAAGDAALLAGLRVAAQRVQPAEALGHGRSLLGVLDRDRLAEDVPQRRRKPRADHAFALQAVTAATHSRFTSESGSSTFQPKAMSWS